ncbi:MAG: hypothetical protein H0X17_03970 [Deltaproteobacteria bacterium]|nr:hypothetical protein [Deltaproteobacteria bacterium]
MNPVALLRSIALLLVVATAPACADFVRKDNYYSVDPNGARSKKYSRINQYTGYGEGALGAQATIAAAYEDAQHAPPPTVELQVYSAALPPGVSLEHGAVKIAESAPYEAIGRYELGYWLASAPQETEVADDLERLAAVTGANVVIVEVTRVSHADTRVNYLSGILLRKRAVAADGASVPAPAIAPSTVPTPAKGARVRAQARLVYTAKPRGCLTTTEFADEVSARLGYSPWIDAATTALHAEIVQRGTAYRATVRLTDGTTKELTGETCRTLTDAVISVVVVGLDAPPRRFD